MMSSSPPPNGSSGFNNYPINNQNQLYNLTSSPAFNEGLNLQLQNLDSTITSINQSQNNNQNNQIQVQSRNYTTKDNNTNDSLTNISQSDNSFLYDQHHQSHSIENQQQQDLIGLPQQEQYHHNHHHHQQQQQQLDSQVSEPTSILISQQNIQLQPHDHNIMATPQFNQIQEQINDSEFDDFVPISNNLDPNLQFPASSSSYVQLSNSNTSSFNSNYFPQSMSGNSISSNLTQTPLQHSRRLSTNALHNLTSTPSQTPIRKSNFVTPRVVGPNGTVYSHTRSKSKIALEKSPLTGNPFYNPSSFLSPKVSKKSHKKNISITNSISLTHLDTDLQLQQLGRSGSPGETPLRTPGRRGNNRYLNDNDNDDDDDNDEDEEEDDNEFDDENVNEKFINTNRRNKNNNDNNNLEKNIIYPESQIIINNNLNQQSPDNTVNINDTTFIMPNILMKHKFGDKLMQSSNDLNNVLTENLENENDSSLFDNISSSNYVNMNYLNGMFIQDPSTVESLQNDIFSYNNSNNKNFTDNYYDTLEQETQQKQKYQYHKRPSLPTQSQSQPQKLNISTPVVLKASSVPQTRTGSVSVESKIQRSDSSLNLNNIAVYKENKNQKIQQNNLYDNKTRFIKTKSFLDLQENSPTQIHSQINLHPHYSVYESTSTLNNDIVTPINPNLQSQIQQSISSSSLSSSNNSNRIRTGIKTSASLQEVAENISARSKEAMLTASSSTTSLPHSISSKKILESPTMKTRSKSKKISFTLSDLTHPEKLDLPQQSARSRSRSKKNVNDEKKIHECPLCHMKFQRPEHVKRHMLSHSSEKPFECPEEGCNKRFNRNDNLKQHLRNIHKKKL